MVESQHTGRGRVYRRRLLLALGLTPLLYPLLKFLNYRVPRKPRVVEVHNAVPASGYVVTPEFILYDREGKIWALSRTCTHLGCKLNYFEETDLLECPCHQSRFSPTTGAPLSGPATGVLVQYPVEKRDSAPYYRVTI